MKGIIFLICLITTLYGNVTFFVATDPHYGKNQLNNDELTNKEAIYDMNRLPTTFYPSIMGERMVGVPEGVIVTGDLTDSGFYWQWFGFSFFRFLHWDGFITDYGLNGENLLNFPVLEGLGNHDELAWGKTVKWHIKERNKKRKQQLNLSDNGLHYSWDWEGVHFVELNIYPGDSKEAAKSLTFLKHDLLNNLKDPKMPLILFHHYGFDGYSDDWWSAEERQAYYDVIKNYNVVVIFQGHQHGMFQLAWHQIDVFASGDIQTNEYLVCEIKDNKLTILPRIQGKWGDWSFTKDLYPQ